LDGSVKEKVSMWWLNLIQTRVDHFLTELKFDFSAVPQNYLMSPPNSIAVVRNNLTLIEACLNPIEDKHNLVQLIVELKIQIYAVIDDFIDEALIVLSDTLRILEDSRTSKAGGPIELFTVWDLSMVNKKLEALAEMSDQADGMWHTLEALSKDVRYLYRMKELEDSSVATERLMDAVPVTGLILARLCTLENELRTVLEVWESRVDEEKRAILHTSNKILAYTGFKKTRENYCGAGDVNRILHEGRLLSKHGRSGWTTDIIIKVSEDMERLICANPSKKKQPREISMDDVDKVTTGKTSAFTFYGTEKCCFSLVFVKGKTLNLEAKTELEKEKFVAAFRFVLATRSSANE